MADLQEQWDSIVVGSGFGGMIVAALLAAKEGKRVLVLEKERNIGGRLISFLGDEVRSWAELVQVLGTSALTRIVRTIPEDHDALINEGLLKGYVFEAGIHGILPWGRLPYILKHLNLPITIFPNDGAVWYSDGKLHDVRRGQPLAWMGERDQKATRDLTRAMVKTSVGEAEELDHTSFKAWMEERADSAKAIEFHKTIAGLNLTLSDAALMSAGDNIKIGRQVVLEGYHLSAGGTGTVAAPGLVLVPQAMVGAVERHGGAVRTNAKVEEIIVQDGRVKGVAAEVEGRLREFHAPVVVSNVPIQFTYRIISERHFPEDFVRRTKGYWAAGAVCGQFGMKRPVIRFAHYVPRLLASNEGFAGEVFCAYWSPSSWAPSRAPLGKQIIDAYAPITDAETRDSAKVNRVIDAMIEFMEEHHPGFRENLEWATFPVTSYLCPVAPAPGQVGDARADNKSPYVDGLYFTGDTVKGWGCAADAAAHAALLCASKITGKDYLQIVPEHMR